MSYVGMNLAAQFDAMQAEIAGAGPDELTALGACIFAGGFSHGMEQAGFTVAGHLELPDCRLGDVVSQQKWPVALAPLHSDYGGVQTAGNNWLDFIDRLKADGNVPDVFYANPPCAAYAGTGKHGGAADGSIMCFLRYCAYEAALRLQPDVWMWELVPGVFTQERSFIDAMAFRAKKFGYRCYAFLTTSAIHGGYQDRRRFHFVASKYELNWEDVYELEPPERRGVHTLGEALRVVQDARAIELSDMDEDGYDILGILPNDVNSYGGAFLDIMPFCPPGSHLRDVPESLMYDHYRPRKKAWTGTGKPGFAHTRARLDRPSPNILGGHTVIHPVEDRYITAREAATIMGFPLDYVFSKGSKAYAEIGKGLCTHNAAFLARVVADGLKRRIRTVPTRSNEKGHEMSWLQAVDWRSRGKKLSLKMSKADQAEWWKKRYPDREVPKEMLA